MSFECVSWRLNVGPSDARNQVATLMRAFCCDALNLCASAGCQCVTGIGEKLCYEADTGGTMPVYQSQGPHWSAIVAVLPETITVTMFFEAPVVPDELRDLHGKLVALGYPIFYSMYHTGTRF